MASSSRVPVVDLDDDDDDLAVAAFSSPPSSRKRSYGAAAAAFTSPADFLDAFSPSPPPSPPLHKKLLLATGAPILLDDSPSPPKRLPSSAPKLPVLVVDDDDMDPSPASVLAHAAFSETPETAVPSAGGIGIDVAETPGFTSPRSVRPPAARGLSSTAPAQKAYGVPISLDSDDESDDMIHKDPLINLPNNTPKSDLLGTNTGPSNDQRLSAGHDTTISKKMQNGKKLTKEEKAKLREERKQKREEDKLQKQALKDQLAKQKKMDKEVQKWESGKLALKCITAEIDSKIIESGSIGGTLISGLAENDICYRSSKNKISQSVLWKMDVPNDIAHALSGLDDNCDMDQDLVSVKYIAIVLQAEEFCDLISNGTFFNHVEKIQKEYPEFTVCYVTNKLMTYINKCEQSQYKNPSNTWRRPPVEEVLCKLATHYNNVHSRQCIDEAEVAEHLVGLTLNLAKCKFRKPLTWLSVHANGAIVSNGFVDKRLAKKNTWLKALIAIPDIQPRYAVAIWKQYPCMRSLLNEYMDPSKTVVEKELLLSDLKWENRLGEEAKRLGHKCSRRVYRMLMAENGDLDTDDPQAGGSG
ncbi:hypothetical protein BS78_06G258700 [Paspalum vaginatum]|nr:hypothetical protein BS78_06G258700 [Paspalum vaginatum]